MTESLPALVRYAVEPLSPLFPAMPEAKRAEARGPGCLYFVIAFALYLTILFPIKDKLDHLGCFSVILLSPSILIPFGIYWWRRRVQVRTDQVHLNYQRDLEWQGLKEELLEKAKREALGTTSSARSLLVVASQTRDRLFSALEKAEMALDSAVAEHAARAIPPFWDAVENAAAALADYEHDIEKMADTARHYYAVLQSHQHSFPPFPYVSCDLPSEETIVARFREVVRAGHTDYQFCDIWEQRNTREAITTGFGSRERAVYEVGANVGSVLRDIHRALDESFDELVRAHVSSDFALEVALASATESLVKQRCEVFDILRSQDAKLDNVQWRRMPLGSKYLR